MTTATGPTTGRAAALARRRADGERLRAYRVAQGWTQAELAAALGLHPNTIARQERGETGIPARRWRKLADLSRGDLSRGGSPG